MNYFKLFFLLLTILLLTLPSYLFCQENFRISGEFRVRTELDGRDFLNNTYPQSFTALRARLSIEKTINKHIYLFMQFQDSRVFGEERSTLTNLKNIDLHQGYLTISNIFDSPFSFTFGRFKLQYGKFKLFGPNDWHNVGRSHDGFKINYNSEKSNIDVFATTHTNFLSYRAGAANITQQYNYTEPPADTGFNIYGFYSFFYPTKSLTVEFYDYFEWDRSKPNNTYQHLQRNTIGFAIEIAPKSSPFFARLDGAYQHGKIYFNEQKNIIAFMVLANIEYQFKKFTASLNADVNSGGDPLKSNEYQLFDNPYSTKHNFQGFMDFFTGLSNQNFVTGIYGLNDFFLSCIYQPYQNLNFQLDAHYFTTYTKYKNSEGKEISVYGPEIDFIARYKLYEFLYIEWGSGLFIAGDVMKDMYKKTLTNRTTDKFDPAFWTYLQFNLKF